MRSIYNTLPFNLVPALMIVEMVLSCLLWLNSFPPSNGISPMLSPHGLVVGSNIDYNWHCHLKFGEYIQTHEEHDDNSMNMHTTGAIALWPTGNTQGGALLHEPHH